MGGAANVLALHSSICNAHDEPLFWMFLTSTWLRWVGSRVLFKENVVVPNIMGLSYVLMGLSLCTIYFLMYRVSLGLSYVQSSLFYLCVITLQDSGLFPHCIYERPIIIQPVLDLLWH